MSDTPHLDAFIAKAKEDERWPEIREALAATTLCAYDPELSWDDAKMIIRKALADE